MKSALFSGIAASLVTGLLAAEVKPEFPDQHWNMRPPESVGLSKSKLDALRELVGGLTDGLRGQ